MEQAEQFLRYTLWAPNFLNRRTLDACVWLFGKESLANGGGGGGVDSPGSVFLVAAVSKAAGSQLCF